jgi:UDP-3-O-[3-hydroxymyristoyl] glucosamine N-acyltransferase
LRHRSSNAHSTFIRSGAKLDNICHIAHNCDLGENGLYTAGFMMAGSTKIGRGFMTGGNSVVSAHLTLADNVHLAGRSTVTNNVTRPELTEAIRCSGCRTR